MRVWRVTYWYRGVVKIVPRLIEAPTETQARTIACRLVAAPIVDCEPIA